jgi:hypothetical protein
MSNMKKRDFYNITTGERVDGENYGTDASTYKKVDNVDMIFDSRGSYLGIRTSRGKFENGKYIVKKGPYDFKSFLDLKIWEGKRCGSMDFIETKDGTFLQIDMTRRP